MQMHLFQFMHSMNRKPKNKGFALSFDAVLGIILVFGILFFAQPILFKEQSVGLSRTNLFNSANDVFSMLDENGYILSEVDGPSGFSLEAI